MIVLGLDPGTTQSALVGFDGSTVTEHHLLPNAAMLEFLDAPHAGPWVLVIEEVASYGMPVGRDVFQTVFWSGRFADRWSPLRFELLPRQKVKLHLCGTPRAKDSNIRQALIDRFGGPESVRKGGPLYKVTQHKMAALAVAVTWFDLFGSKPDEIRPGIQPEF
jgi:hypothetical protein